MQNGEWFLINHAAALTPGHAFLTIRELRVAILAAVTRLDAVGPWAAAPQAPCHAAQHRPTWRAPTLHLLNNAVFAFTAVIWASLGRGHHQPQQQQYYWHNSCCRRLLLHICQVSNQPLLWGVSLGLFFFLFFFFSLLLSYFVVSLVFYRYILEGIDQKRWS